MTLGGPKGFLLKNREKKIHIFRSLLTIEERLESNIIDHNLDDQVGALARVIIHIWSGP